MDDTGEEEPPQTVSTASILMPSNGTIRPTIIDKSQPIELIGSSSVMENTRTFGSGFWCSAHGTILVRR